MTADYKAINIQVLKGLERIRQNYDLKSLLEESKKYKSIKEFSKNINIEEKSLGRALREAKILQKFPSLDRSKAGPLNHFKIEKELDLFSQKVDINNITFRELRRVIKNWDKKIEKNPKILLSSLQGDLIIGSLMGDANARKRWGLTYFRCGHSEKQKRYLKWKYNQFTNFIQSNIHISIKKNRSPMYEFQTLSHNIFNFYHKLFYKYGRKQISKEVLNKLNPRSLAFWICDDGSYCNSLHYIILCTNSFSYKEHILMKEYFNEKWDLNPAIGFRDNKYYYLRFTVKDTKKLISIIRKFIPIKNMLYKIGEKNVGF